MKIQEIATVKVVFDSGKGASRKLFKDEYGYFVKHQGVFVPVSVGAFDSVENGVETCSWFMDHINPFISAYRAGELPEHVLKRHIAGEEGFTGSLYQAEQKIQEELKAADSLDDCEYMQEDVSFEDPLDGMVAERPYLALLEMILRKMDYSNKDNITVSMISKHNVERFKLALGHLDLKHYGYEQINDEWVEIIHDTIEQPLEESIEQMIQHKCRTKYERVKCFERYNDLLMKSLKEGLNALEEAEYTYLYNMLDIKEGENLLNLMREMYEMRGDKNA